MPLDKKWIATAGRAGFAMTRENLIGLVEVLVVFRCVLRGYAALAVIGG